MDQHEIAFEVLLISCMSINGALGGLGMVQAPGHNDDLEYLVFSELMHWEKEPGDSKEV